MKALVFFDSLGGNTKKVAYTIYDTCCDLGVDCYCINLADVSDDFDFFVYDFIFIGSGVIDWLPTPNLMSFIKKQMKRYSVAGVIEPSAPLLPGKFGVCFGTFAGPHTGLSEAYPMTMWLRSFLEHLGYSVLDQWHTPGEFMNNDLLNKKGRMGDISGRPDQSDLKDIKNKTIGIIKSVAFCVH